MAAKMPSIKMSRENIVITVVGDGAVGKTAIIIVNTHNQFPEEYLPTTFEYHPHEIIVDNVKHNLVLRDTAGQEGYDMMLPLNFINTNCFLLCFSVEKSEHSYENVDLKWIPLLRHYNPETPIILVGTKIDMRQNLNTECYTYEDGTALMRKIKAYSYVECSSKLNHEVENVIVQAVKAHLNFKSSNSEKMVAVGGRHVKLVLLGDSCVGKHNLLLTYTENKFPDTYLHIVCENYVKDIIVDDIGYNMELWEVAGQEEYSRLRPVLYPNTNCFLLCFSVDNEFSYKSVKDDWIKEVRRFNPTTPVVLVATKIDLRSSLGRSCFTYKNGEEMMNNIGAVAYVECSAKAGVGIEKVFIAGIRAHEKHVAKEKNKRSNNKSCVLS